MNLTSFLFTALLSLLYASLAQAAIYGADDRREIYQAPQYRQVAKAVAVAVGHNLLIANGDGTTRVDLVRPLSDFLCRDERFAGESSLGVCSGFLIGDRYLLTAGHCALPHGVINDQFDPFCENFDWIFDYSVDPWGHTMDQKIPMDHLFRCKRTIRAENIEHLTKDVSSPPGNDFMLIELDRPVGTEIKPLTLAKAPITVGQSVYTIGHPLGMPNKFSGIANILENREQSYYTANLDTEGGNSGGPVFNLRNEVVGILVSGHPFDLFTDTKNHCERFNRCTENGLTCNVDSNAMFLGQVSNFIQRIEAVLPYLPK